LTFWIIANTVYALVVEDFATSSKSGTGEVYCVNDGSVGFLEVFACYLAGLVVYKVFFGSLHILKFKFLNTFITSVKVPYFDLKAEV
jgi:hypothetical protein